MERKFFRIDLSDLRRFFLNERFFDHKLGPQNYLQLCYGDFCLKDIVDLRRILSKKAAVLKLPYRLYCYEENGTFYEFFSGRVVGTRRAPQNGKISSRYYNPDEIVRNGYTLTSFQIFENFEDPVKELSATSFASEVEPYAPYKSHMAAEMSKLLDAIDAQYKRLRDAADAGINAANRAEQKNQSWLDDMIKNR